MIGLMLFGSEGLVVVLVLREVSGSCMDIESEPEEDDEDEALGDLSLPGIDPPDFLLSALLGIFFGSKIFLNTWNVILKWEGVFAVFKITWTITTTRFSPVFFRCPDHLRLSSSLPR